MGNRSTPPPSVESVQLLRRLEKWALQSASREILPKEKGLSHCCRSVIPRRESVEVWKSQHERFHYGGLITCGSVWVCPVCGAKITERRRVELTEAFVKNREQGGSEQLWTFTARHNKGQSLSYVLDALLKARKLMLNRKPWKRLNSSLGVKGTIRGLEVTHSFENGWHPHFHVLAFMSAVYTHESMKAIEEMIFHEWQKACVDSGLDAPSRAHGVTVEDGSKAAAYVGKWGLEHEMTKSHVKKGREGHHTPFDFLRLYVAGDLRYGALFSEYAKAFKGKRQLVWSEGLRDILGLGEEVTDEVLAESQDENAVKFASIPLSVWRVIVKKNKRGEVLEVCKNGKDALLDYMITICESAGYFEQRENDDGKDLCSNY